MKDKEKDTIFWKQYFEERFAESRDWKAENVEPQWFVNTMYYKGFHNLKFNKDTNTFVRDKNPLDFFINLTYLSVRAVRTAIMKTRPTWDVEALPYARRDNEQNTVCGEFLSFQYKETRLQHVTNQLLINGLVKGIGVVEYGYNHDGDDGRGEFWVKSLDPFDTYIDPFCTCKKDCRYIIKTVCKPLESLLSAKDTEGQSIYDKKILEEEGETNKTTDSDYKNLIPGNEKNSKTKNILIREGWFRTDEGIRVITTTSKGEIIRNELTDLDDLYFEFFQPDIDSNSIYGEGWVKNIVPLNKGINYLETSRLEYNIKLNKGRFLIPKGAGVRTVTNIHGEKIYYSNRNLKPEIITSPPLGGDIDRQLGALNGYMQNLGATNEASLGRVPAGVKSGVALQELIASNLAQLSDLGINLAETLARVGEAFLKMGYKYQNIAKTFKTEKDKYYAIIGESAVIPDSMEGVDGVIQLPEKSSVTVTVTSGSSHTKEALREILIQLRARGDVSRETVLENFDIDPDREKQRLEKEQMPPQQTPIEAQNQGILEQVEGEESPLPEGQTMDEGDAVTDEDLEQYSQMLEETGQL